jgi:hypothetical protein
MTPVSPQLSVQAFGAESDRLAEVAEGADDAAYGRLSPCAPWTAAELLCHVRMTMGRLQTMLADPEPQPEPEPDGAGLVAAAGYYRAISGSPRP